MVNNVKYSVRACQSDKHLQNNIFCLHMSLCWRGISCYIHNQAHTLPMTGLICRSVYLCVYTEQKGFWLPGEIPLQLWQPS